MNLSDGGSLLKLLWLRGPVPKIDHHFYFMILNIISHIRNHRSALEWTK